MNIRIAGQEDAQRIIEWSFANREANDLDPDVLNYPLTEIFCAENGKPLGYLPAQLAAVLESFAPNPEATEQEKNAALYGLTDAIVETAANKGIKEIYFIGSNEEVNAFAERLGFKRIDLPVYRLKVGK